MPCTCRALYMLLLLHAASLLSGSSSQCRMLCLHNGHSELLVSQWSMQGEWKRCRHGSVRSSSSASNESKHTQQLGGATAAEGQTEVRSGRPLEQKQVTLISISAEGNRGGHFTVDFQTHMKSA